MLKRQLGFSMLELMIAVLILAIGLLGMAAMQSVALSSNQEAQFRLQAMAIVDDLASRMRANRPYINVSSNKYSLIPDDNSGFNLYSTADYNNTNLVVDPVTPSATMECTDPSFADDLASLSTALNCRVNSDINDIRRQLNPITTGRLLPANSVLFVDCADKTNTDYADVNDSDPCSPGSVYTIYLFWPLGPANVEAGQIQTSAQLNNRCLTKITTEIDAGTLGTSTLSADNVGCVIMDLVP